MGGENVQRTARRIRIQTENGAVEGVLNVAAILRTLDDLNMDGRSFLTVEQPAPVGMSWAFGVDELAVNKGSILFVMELSNPPTSNKQFAGTFSRASMRLRVGPYDVEGFLHVPPGGECLRRLNQSNHPFVSLTSVSVSGPDTQFATPFLAVNRERILLAQEVFHDSETADDELEMTFEVTS